MNTLKKAIEDRDSSDKEQLQQVCTRRDEAWPTPAWPTPAHIRTHTHTHAHMRTYTHTCITRRCVYIPALLPHVGNVGIYIHVCVRRFEMAVD